MSSYAKKTVYNAWQHVRRATNEHTQGSNFIFHRGILLILITAGIGWGLLLGVALSLFNWRPTSRDLHYLGYPGKLFSGALKAMNIPIILASVISAAGSMEFKLCLKTAISGLCLFTASAYFSSWIGISTAILFQPVHPDHFPQDFLPKFEAPQPLLVTDVFLDLFRSFFPRNIVEATLKNYRTKLQPPKNPISQPGVPDSQYWKTWKIEPTYADGTNFNGLIVYGIVMGLAAVKLGVYGKPLIAFTRCLSECVAFLCNCIMWAAPVGVASLIARDIASQRNIVRSFQVFWRYITCVCLSFSIWVVIILVVLKITTKQSIWKYLKDLMPVLFTCFGVANSLSAAPVLLTCLDANGVNPRVSRFLAPLGCIISLAGSTIFTNVAVVGIIQLLEYDKLHYLDFFEMSLLAPPAVAGIAGGSGSFIYPINPLLAVTVGDKGGVPEKANEFFLPVDWFVDRLVTVVNMLTVASIITIVCHLRRKELEDLPDYNAILKEGLVFKRLSLLKTSVTSQRSAAGEEDVETLKQRLRIDDPDPENITSEEKKQRRTLRRLTAILEEAPLPQTGSSVQADGEKPKSSSKTKVKKVKKPKFVLKNIKKAIANPLGGQKKPGDVHPS